MPNNADMMMAPIELFDRAPCDAYNLMRRPEILLATAEEEATHDCADHRARPAEIWNPVNIAGTDAGNCSLNRSGQPTGSVEIEEVMVAALGGLQPEQGVRDDGEQRDQNDNENPGVEAESEPQSR